MTCHTNVSDFLLDGKEPGKLALRFLHNDHSYGELQAATSQVAQHLLRRGARKGDRVILISENSLFWVAAYLGAIRAGLVCVPLPTSIAAQELDYILRITESTTVYVEAGYLIKNRECFRGMNVMSDRERSELPEFASCETFAAILADTTVPGCPLPTVSPDDLAALMFTSGSTGRPRGVMVSHANIIANTESIVRYMGLSGKDRIMAVLPFHYCFGTSLLHTHLRVGGTLVVDTRFMYPEVVLDRMLEAECTGFAGVPSHFQILLRSSSVRRRTFPHLRYIQQAGGYLAPSFIRELRAAMPQTQIFIMYGQTEATARLSYLPPELLDTKPGSIGKGIPDVKLQVLNEAGEEVRPGEVGEIVAEGKNVARGYWCAPEDSAISFRQGKLHTGDLATVDAEGFIYIVDRVKEFLKSRGERVSCRHIEEQMLAFEDLLEVAVVGTPDDVLGEAVKAFVVPRAPAGDDIEERFLLFCRKRMPPHLLPKEIVVLKALPKNSAGKVLKQMLKAV